MWRAVSDLRPWCSDRPRSACCDRKLPSVQARRRLASHSRLVGVHELWRPRKAGYPRSGLPAAPPAAEQRDEVVDKLAGLTAQRGTRTYARNQMDAGRSDRILLECSGF